MKLELAKTLAYGLFASGWAVWVEFADCSDGQCWQS